MSSFAHFYILSKNALPVLRKRVKLEQLLSISALGLDVSPQLEKLLLKAMKGPVTVNDPELIRQLKKCFPKMKVPNDGGEKRLAMRRRTVIVTTKSSSRVSNKENARSDAERSVYDYILEHGKERWQYDYSGYNFIDICRYLKEVKKINLERGFDAGKNSYWFQITLAMRERYLDRLHSSNFIKAEIKDWIWEHVMLDGPEEDDEQSVDNIAKAMIAGIGLYRKYMRRVNDDDIVLWRIG